MATEVPERIKQLEKQLHSSVIVGEKSTSMPFSKTHVLQNTTIAGTLNAQWKKPGS